MSRRSAKSQEYDDDEAGQEAKKASAVSTIKVEPAIDVAPELEQRHTIMPSEPVVGKVR
ncbi:unnamed protein product [Strongylus vulgaris]|uniref:Uncharacterized protein n=1 Tax=Strongylus vulgaris TaxID=40348 RepID=A0A3P7JK78_STRVU|nr:unnamed protein product [Strongylus vulgaris]